MADNDNKKKADNTVRDLYKANNAFKIFKDNDSDESVELRAKIAVGVLDCISFQNSTLNQQWESNLKHYMRQAMPGDAKIKGRSKYVTNDVQERVDWFVGQSVGIFEQQKSVVCFSPNSIDQRDKELAAQQNAVLEFVLRNNNSHVATLTPWFKNAALFGLGVLNVSFDEEVKEGRLEVIKGVTDEQLVQMGEEQEAGDIRMYEPGPDYKQELPPELLAQVAPMLAQSGMDPAQLVEQADALLPMVRDVPIRRIKRQPRFRFTVVAIEDFIISRDADFDPNTGGIRAHVQGHRAYATKQELIERGFNKELVETIPHATEKTSGVAIERQAISNLDQGRARRPFDINVYEIYMCMPISEGETPRNYRFTIAGEIDTNPILLGFEETSAYYPYAALVPYAIPNTLFGQGVADRVSAEQDLKSKITRAVIDNTHKVLDPDKVVNPALANINDVLNPQIGKTIRSEDPTAGVSYIQTPFVAGNAMPLLDTLNVSMDASTGVGANMVSLSANDLADVTATGVKERKNAQQILMEHVCYQFANTGYRYLAKCVIDLLRSKPEEAQKFIQRLTDKFVDLAIDEWDADMDVSTNVEFGLMDKEVKNQTLMTIYGLQQQAMAFQAATPQNMYQTLIEIAENMGLQDAVTKFTDPAQNPPPPPPQPVDPNAGLVEIEKVKAQLRAQADEAEREFQWNKLRVEDDFKRDELATKFEIDKAEIEAKYGAQVDIARLQAETERTRTNVEAADIMQRAQQDQRQAEAEARAQAEQQRQAQVQQQQMPQQPPQM